MDNQAPDFIQNLGKQNIGEKPLVNNTSDVPDFIKQPQTPSVQPNIKDVEVSNELWLDLDTTLEQNAQAAQEYVDSLSEEDYKTWRNLRKEWYSISAAKTLLENQDLLYDISKPGANKYLSNKPSLTNTLTNIAQKYNIGYEQTLHPWNESIQNYLDQGTARLEENLGKENLMNNWIEKNNPYWKMSPRMAESSINTYENFANIAQIPKVGWEILLSLWWAWVNAIDQWLNRIGIIGGWIMNTINEKRGSDKRVEINYGEDRSNLLGSYIQSARDIMWAWLTVEYPIVTYIFSMLWAAQTDRKTLMERVDWWFDNLIWKLLDLDVIENWMDNNLNEADQEALKEDIKYSLYRAAAKITGWTWKKISRSKAVRNFETVSKMVDNYWRRNAKLEMKKNYNLRKAASQEPIWTEVLNEKGKTIARSTPEWAEFTPYWAADTLVAWGKWYIKGAGEAIASYLKNKNRQILPRDPNAPVWELPEIGINKPVTWEVTPKNEEPVAVEEVVEETPKVSRKTQTVLKTAEKPTGEWVGTFIKRVTNELAGTEWWLDSTLIEKLKTSKDLQNEFINTIDPYLKSWWAENPSWVISEQLADLVDSAKIALETKRENNMTFRKWQRQYWVQIPESEKISQRVEDLQIKELIKLLERSQDNPEKFLEYLMKLPEEKMKYMNQLIPDFSNHLQLVKDTLDITKAITKPDIVDKFLSFKSWWWNRRKWFIKKLVYQKLRDAYQRAWVQGNLRDIENMLNNLSEEEMIQLEESLGENDLPWFMKEDFFSQIIWAEERAAFKWESWNPLLDIQKRSPKEVFNQLIQEWYIDESGDLKPFKTEKDILNFKLKNGQTVWEIADAFRLSFEPRIFQKLGMEWQADLARWIIYYRNNISDLYAQFAAHEIGHQLMWWLTTSEYMDLLEWLSKATENLKEYKEYRRVWMSWFIKQYPTDYKSLSKSMVWALEYAPDMFANLLTYWDINWLASYLQPYLSEQLWAKVKNILEEVGKKLWDNLSTVLVNGKEFTPREEMEKLINKLQDKETQEAPKNDLIKEYNGGVWYENRLKSFQKVDPNVKWWDMDLTIDSPTFWQFMIELKDGTKLSWEDYKNTLSEEVRKWLYREEKLVDSTRKDLLKDASDLPEYWNDGKYDQYKETLRNIDPDIVGLREKDWKLCVDVLWESYRERWELPDRPGMQELKTIPIDEFFVFPEDIKKLPKDLQEIIDKQKALSNNEQNAN